MAQAARQTLPPEPGSLEELITEATQAYTEACKAIGHPLSAEISHLVRRMAALEDAILEVAAGREEDRLAAVIGRAREMRAAPGLAAAPDPPRRRGAARAARDRGALRPAGGPPPGGQSATA